MKRLPRKLFRALGALRDLQVLEAWVKQLTSADDPLRAKLIKVLKDRQAEPQHQVRRAVRQFDQRAWDRLARTVSARVRLVSPNGLTAQCLALERLRGIPAFARPRHAHEHSRIVARAPCRVEALPVYG